MALIDGIIIKGGHIAMPEALQRQALQHLHVDHVEIEKETKLLACKSIYLIDKTLNIENHIKITLHVLIFRKHRWRKK